MAHFEVLILPIDNVEKHTQADRLSLNHIRGYVAVSNKNEDGTNRYHAGQLVAYVPVGSVVPVSLLKVRGYWDEEKNKGFLGGENGDIVQPINLRGVVSEGLIFPTIKLENSTGFWIENGNGDKRYVEEGAVVNDFLGITKVNNSFAHTRHPPTIGWTQLTVAFHPQYEVEDLKKFPDMLKGKQVVATELLHGVLCIVGYDRRLNDPFFVMDGSGGNRILKKELDNIYTKTAKPIWEEIKRYLLEMPAVERFYIFGEIIGPGIQTVYGLEDTEFRAIDIQMGLMGGGRDSIPFGFIGVRKYELFKWLNIASVPVVWAGEYDYDIIHGLANEPSTIGGGIREGVVITAEDENLIDGRRPILKLVSDKFLLRKGTNLK